jgi:tetratricopeptide (TPR) repeat protein
LYIQKKSNDSTICFHIGELQEKLHVNLAKDIYLANVKKFPNDSRNFLRLSEIFYKFGDFKRAKIALEQVKRIEGDVSIEILSRLARCYKENNERNKEIAIYKEVLIKDNTNFTANKFLGIYCYESGEISEGLSYLELAKSQNYNDPDMLYILGKIYLKDKFSNEGLMFLQSAKKQKNNDIKIRMLIIETYKKYLKLKEALIEIESLLKIDRSFKNLDLYAKTLFENKNYNVAENIALELRKREPRNIDLMMFLVQIKIEQNLFDDALEYCKMISYVDSRYGPALCKRGDIYALKQDVEKAKEFYLKAIKSSPKYALSFYKLAMIYKYSGDVDLYIYNITKAAELDSTEVLINEELKKIQVKKN